MDYLLAGPEEAGTGRLLVTMQSVVVPWTPRLGLLISEGLRNGCPWNIRSKKAAHTSQDFTWKKNKTEKGQKKPLDNMLNHQGELSKSHTLDESRYPHCVGVQHKIKTDCMVIFNKLYLTLKALFALQIYFLWQLKLTTILCSGLVPYW